MGRIGACLVGREGGREVGERRESERWWCVMVLLSAACTHIPAFSSHAGREAAPRAGIAHRAVIET